MLAGEPNTGTRFAEFVINPYADSGGDHDCVVTIRNNTNELPNQLIPAVDPFKMLCESPVDAVLITFAATVSALITAATATAIAGISWWLAIPFIGAVMFSILAPIVTAAATTALVGLLTAVQAALGAGPTIGEEIARVCNLASSMGQKQLVRDLVSVFTVQQRPADPPGSPPTVNDGFRLMTGQLPPDNAARPPDPACMRRIDGFEFAFPATAGSNGLFDFLNDVFALTDEFYNNNTPMGFGMSLRITRGTTALIGMQQFARTAHVEFFFLRGLRGADAFYDRLHNLAVLRGGIPHWGLKHKLNATRVDQIYGANVVQWRQSLLRIILGGGPNTRTTFRTTFSVDRNLEPPSGCALPMPPVFLTSIDKIFSARKRADWLKSTFGKKGEGKG